MRGDIYNIYVPSLLPLLLQSGMTIMTSKDQKQQFIDAWCLRLTNKHKGRDFFLVLTMQTCCIVCWLIVLYDLLPGVGSHGSCRTMAATIQSMQEIAPSRKPLLLLLFHLLRLHRHHAMFPNDETNWRTQRNNQFGVEADMTTVWKLTAMVGGCVFVS